jgi:DNA-binding NtrC family response regulator
MQRLVACLGDIAATDLPVLICGEPGSGKSTLARQVHADSPRRDAPLTILDSATMTAAAIDGLAQCAGHTVLLEGIQALQQAEQNSLARLLDAPGVAPRLIVTTNQDPVALLTRRRLRADLVYRLDVVRLDIPPLRQRPTDIVFLARHFLTLAARHFQRRIRTLSAAAEGRLLQHSWRGNVHELRTCLFESVLHGSGVFLQAEDLRLEPDTNPEADMIAALAQMQAADSTELYARTQRVILEWALATCHSQRGVAAFLGITCRAVRMWMRQHHVKRNGLQASAPETAVPDKS